MNEITDCPCFSAQRIITFATQSSRVHRRPASSSVLWQHIFPFVSDYLGLRNPSARICPQ